MKRALGMVPGPLFAPLVVAVLALSSPWSATAWALCPNCLGQNRSLTPTLQLVGLFLLLPFMVALIVTRAIARAGRRAPGVGGVSDAPSDPATRV
jgi:hypothetical protein